MLGQKIGALTGISAPGNHSFNDTMKEPTMYDAETQEIFAYIDAVSEAGGFINLDDPDWALKCRPPEPKWEVPPAQMFADVTWDRIAGAWRFINPLDDPQHHRQAVAIGDAVAATKKLETVPVIAIGSADDLATVSFARDTKFLAVFVSNNPFTIAAAEAFIKDAKARGIAARTIVVEG